MSGGKDSEEVVVGYRYFLGMHLAICHGPVDRVREIWVGEKKVWPLGSDYPETYNPVQTSYTVLAYQFTQARPPAIDMYGNPVPFGAPLPEPVAIPEGIQTGTITKTGSIYINAPVVFGGDSREGGVQGFVDVAFGEPTQPVNGYLQRVLGGIIPAFRGVLSLIVKQAYVASLNPYIKPWTVYASRIKKSHRGGPQWYPQTAAIGRSGAFENPQWIGIAIDCSSSMLYIEDGSTRAYFAQQAVIGFLNTVKTLMADSEVRVDIMITFWGTGQATYYAINADDDKITDLQGQVVQYRDYGGTDFRTAVASAPAFYASAPADADKTFLFLTDGETLIEYAQEASATLLAIPGIQSYCFNLDEYNISKTALLDNTPWDGVPVLNSGDPSKLQAALDFSLSGGRLDMNPAHIIRECLTSSDWGKGFPESDLDDASFTAAANTLYGEKFGLSLLWLDSGNIDDFIGLVLEHIDGTLYTDRVTNKWTLKLVRADYVEANLPVLGPDDIKSVDDYARPSPSELTNRVVVTYWDRVSRKDTPITLDNDAMREANNGVVNSRQINRTGITDPITAALVAQRELQTLSSPLLTANITLNRVGINLYPGAPFKLTWPELGANELVMRVGTIDYGDLQNGDIRISCVEDVFAMPKTPLVLPPVSAWEDPRQPPQAPDVRYVGELPYWTIVKELTGENPAAYAAIDPSTNSLAVTAVRKSPNTISSSVWTAQGTEAFSASASNVGTTPMCASLTTRDAAGRLDAVIPFSNRRDPDRIRFGKYAAWGSELVMVYDFNDEAGTITVTRGVLDTVPVEHPAGSVMLFIEGYQYIGRTAYEQTEQVRVMMLPKTSNGELRIDNGVEDTYTFNARHIRPYPPGQFKVNGVFFPETMTGNSGLSLTWAHRNRIQQMVRLVGFTEDGVTPEANTVYNLRLYDENNVLFKTVAGTNLTEYNYPLASEIADAGISDGAGGFRQNGKVRIELETERDTWTSFQKHDLTIKRIGYGFNYGEFYGGAIGTTGYTGTTQTQTTPGSVPSNNVSLADHGGVPGAGGAAIANAFVAALNALKQQGGGTLLVPAGTYAFGNVPGAGSGSVISVSGLTNIVIDARGAIFTLTTSSEGLPNLFYFVNPNNVTFWGGKMVDAGADINNNVKGAYFVRAEVTTRCSKFKMLASETDGAMGLFVTQNHNAPGVFDEITVAQCIASNTYYGASLTLVGANSYVDMTCSNVRRAVISYGLQYSTIKIVGTHTAAAPGSNAYISLARKDTDPDVSDLSIDVTMSGGMNHSALIHFYHQFGSESSPAGWMQDVNAKVTLNNVTNSGGMTLFKFSHELAGAVFPATTVRGWRNIVLNTTITGSFTGTPISSTSTSSVAGNSVYVGANLAPLVNFATLPSYFTAGAPAGGTYPTMPGAVNSSLFKPTPTFFDDFDGNALSNRWNKGIWYEGPPPAGTYRVANGCLELCTVAGMPLTGTTTSYVVIDTDPNSANGATNGFEQKFGLFQCEAQLPVGKGYWPAFWLFNHIGVHRPEIDAFEAYPGGAYDWSSGHTAPHPMRADATIHPLDDPGGYAAPMRSVTLSNGVDLSAAFHKYAVEWDVNFIKFYFDDVLVRTITDADTLAYMAQFPLYLMFDFGLGSAAGDRSSNPAISPVGFGPDPANPTANVFRIKNVCVWQYTKY